MPPARKDDDNAIKELNESTKLHSKLKTKSSKSRELLRLENENSISSRFLLKQNVKKCDKIVRPPVSSVLDQVKNFLPKMKEAEDILRRKIEISPDDVNIEHIDENADRVIEMNLSLFQYSGESASDVSEPETGNSDEEDFNVRKNKLIQEI